MVKKIFVSVAVAGVVCALPAISHAEFLYSSFLIPSFYDAPNTEYAEWDIFYAPHGANSPDVGATFGIKQTASEAGVTPPFGSQPEDPTAFWDPNNATISQVAEGDVMILGAGTSGSIYSPAVTLQFELADSTPYSLGTVVFQFQTAGSMVDFDSIKLVGESAGGPVELSADEYIREFKGGSSSFGGSDNRVALQWDLTDLGITSYKILWEADGTSMSLQAAVLDTAEVYSSVVPQKRTWLGVGPKVWSEGSNWAEGSTSVANGNVFFENVGNTTITLDGNRTVGEMVIDTASDIVINSQGGSKLTVNTGISTGETGGDVTINSDYVFNAMNVFNIEGGEVQLNGVVSGGYGFVKIGEGKLVLSNNNTFGGSTGGIGLQGGTLRMEGVNTYAGTTGILWGRLELAANALSGGPGALGNTFSTTVGASSVTYAGITEAAQLVIDGDFTMGRNVTFAAGTFAKELGATGTTSGATFSGAVSLGATSTNIRLFAEGASDKVTFSGAITGGAVSQSVTINGDGHSGTVVYSGTTKAYANSTTVASGTLLMQTGSGYSGNGNFTVSSGATLQVDGTISGTGTFSLDSGGTLKGRGTVNRTVVAGGVLSVIGASRDDGVLTLTSLDATAGVKFSLEVGNVASAASALVAITGEFKASLANEGINIFFEDAGSLQANVLYTLFTYGTQSQLSVADFKLLNDGLVVDSWSIGDGKVQVQFTAVPEPSTWALLIGAGVIGFIFRGRIGRRAHA